MLIHEPGKWDSLQKVWRDMVCLSRPYPFKFFKGCLPQILLGPLLNTLSQMFLRSGVSDRKVWLKIFWIALVDPREDSKLGRNMKKRIFASYQINVTTPVFSCHLILVETGTNFVFIALSLKKLYRNKS